MTFSRGSAIAKIVGENTKLHDDFDPNVQMWVYNEQVDDNGTMRALPDIINERHENIKYLPNIKIPKNIVANPDIQDVSRSADIIIFVIPDQVLQLHIDLLFVQPNSWCYIATGPPAVCWVATVVFAIATVAPAIVTVLRVALLVSIDRSSYSNQ